MFFFKKKKPKVTVKPLDDSIWISKAMRYKGFYKACERLLEENRLVFIIPFFPETMDELAFVFNHQEQLRFKQLEADITYSELDQSIAYLVSTTWLQKHFLRSPQSFLAQPISFMFPEHYPSTTLEIEILTELNKHEWQDATSQFYDSLDSQLMSAFGSDRIMNLLEGMGMDKEEEISHSMVSKSIRRAQEKLTSSIKYEQKAASQEEWFKKNMKN